MIDPRKEFDRVWPWLDEAQAAYGRTHTKQQVLDRVLAGRAQLWWSPNSVVLTEGITHPIGLRSLNVWLQGGDLSEILTLHPRIEAYARAQGADRLIAWGRPGWLRRLDGWHACGTRRAKWLRDDVPEHLRETKHADKPA